MRNNKISKCQSVFQQYGPVVKTEILRQNKIFSRDISWLISEGLIRKVKTGYYIWTKSDYNISDIEIASTVIPNGIVCLQSAAYYYDLTTLNPTKITVAISSDSKRPVIPTHPPIELVTMPAKTFHMGLANKSDINDDFRIYNKERTVCDFFRKKNSLGEDLALEILKKYMSDKPKLQILFEYAEEFRIKSRIKPYVEALI